MEADEFSDGSINPIEFFKDFLYSPHQSIIPIVKEVSKLGVPGTNTNAFLGLPNSFKIGWVQENHVAEATGNVVHPDLVEAYLTPTDRKYSSFFFFQNNLTVKIE